MTRALCALMLVASAGLGAQQTTLVNVDITHVANDVARNARVNASEIPLSVQVPIAVAATVCKVAADALAQQAARGAASCTASGTSQQLEDFIQQQAKSNG